jgi:hydrogenase nickel incorporation protein HypB
MCDDCGCAQPEETITIQRPGTLRKQGEAVHCSRPHRHERMIAPDQGRAVFVEQEILSKNDRRAAMNRTWFRDHGILALNLVSSPGSGKTTLLEKTISSLGGRLQLAVIEGDQQTLRDAERIEATGAPAVQINTGTGCHLDAEMIHRAMHLLPLRNNSLLFIENVGNLVCPALFDLGEAFKVVIISVTEGEDKPQKYPHMFHASQICLFNKTDLLPYVHFQVEKCKEYALRVNPGLTFFEVSAMTGAGMEAWSTWLEEQVEARTR